MKKIIILAGQGDSTSIVYHALAKDFDILKVIQEQPVAKKNFLKRRAKRLGWWTVIGQVAFVAIIQKVLAFSSRKRVQEISAAHDLNKTEISSKIVQGVNSVNSAESLNLLKEIQPDIIIVNGTRIISKKVLAATNAVFINMHAGITPKYRGVHGGYWALASKDPKHCGVTVHLVDAGIDTGGVLYQELIQPGKKDNFVTYPTLQLAAGLPALKQAISDAQNGDLKPYSPQLESKLYYHPTFWGYLWRWLCKRIK